MRKKSGRNLHLTKKYCLSMRTVETLAVNSIVNQLKSDLGEIGYI